MLYNYYKFYEFYTVFCPASKKMKSFCLKSGFRCTIFRYTLFSGAEK